MDVEEANTKGGHSLRKRARVDYAMKDDPMSEELASSSRAGRRRRGAGSTNAPNFGDPSTGFQNDDEVDKKQSPRSKTPNEDSPSQSRKNPRRKAVAAIKSFQEPSSDIDMEDENPPSKRQKNMAKHDRQLSQLSSSSRSGYGISHQLIQPAPGPGTHHGHGFTHPGPDPYLNLAPRPGPAMYRHPDGSFRDFMPMQPNAEPVNHYFHHSQAHIAPHHPHHPFQQPPPPPPSHGYVHGSPSHSQPAPLFPAPRPGPPPGQHIPPPPFHSQSPLPHHMQYDHYSGPGFGHSHIPPTYQQYPPQHFSPQHVQPPPPASLPAPQQKQPEQQSQLQLQPHHPQNSQQAQQSSQPPQQSQLPVQPQVQSQLQHQQQSSQHPAQHPETLQPIYQQPPHHSGLLPTERQQLEPPSPACLEPYRTVKPKASKSEPIRPHSSPRAREKLPAKLERPSLIVTLPHPRSRQHSVNSWAGMTKGSRTPAASSPSTTKAEKINQQQEAKHDIQRSTKEKEPILSLKKTTREETFPIDIFNNPVDTVIEWALKQHLELAADLEDEPEQLPETEGEETEDEDRMEDIETTATSPLHGPSLYIGNEVTKLPKPIKDMTQKVASRLEEIQNGDDDEAVSQLDISRCASPTGSGQPTAAPSPSPGEEINSKALSGQFLEKQFLFPKLRDPQEFEDWVEAEVPDTQEASDQRLYLVAKALQGTLQKVQEEYNQLKVIIDDEANSIRRQAQEESLARAEANGKRYPRREHKIELKGARKPKTEDPRITKQREQDKLEADIYFYQYDPREAMIGAQNPVTQREGLGSARLRSRPKQSARAAEADDSAAGKRTRKLREFPDMVPEGIRRSGRPKKPKSPEDNEDEIDTSNLLLSQPKSRRGRRGRAASEEPNGTSTSVLSNKVDEDGMNNDSRKRKRPGRPPASQKTALVIKVNGASIPEENEDLGEPGPSTKRQRRTVGSRLYSERVEESRPGTASSNSTIDANEPNNTHANRQMQRTSEHGNILEPSIEEQLAQNGGRKKRRKKDPPLDVSEANGSGNVPIAIAPNPSSGGHRHSQSFVGGRQGSLARGGPAPASQRETIKLRRRSNDRDAVAQDQAASSNGMQRKGRISMPSSLSTQGKYQQQHANGTQPQHHTTPFILVDPSAQVTSIKKVRPSPGPSPVPEQHSEEQLSEHDRWLLGFLTEEVLREVFKDREHISLTAKLTVARELDGQDYFKLEKGKKMSISMKMRWALGEMNEPQARRTATMQRKKLAKATEDNPPLAPAPLGGPTPIAPNSRVHMGGTEYHGGARFNSPPPLHSSSMYKAKAAFDPVADALSSTTPGVPSIAMSMSVSRGSAIPIPHIPHGHMRPSAIGISQQQQDYGVNSVKERGKPGPKPKARKGRGKANE